MQTPYQQFAVPQAVVYPVAAKSSDDSACCPCCVEPACCSRVGSCPCFCSGYTAAFSIALSSIWMALPMLITAISVTDMFEVTSYGDSLMSLGMWQICSYGGDSYYYYECDSYNGEWLSDNTKNLFNAMRSLAVISTAFTLLTGILGAIRLARIQRNKPNSNRINNTVLISALLAMATAATSFGLTFSINSSLSDSIEDETDQWGMGSTFGVSWVMLTVGMGLLVVGVAVHLIAHCCYQYNVVGDEASEQPGMAEYGVSGGYPASSSVFAHPQPLHHAVVAPPAVYYPTAAAVHYPQYAQPPIGHIYQ